MILIKSGIVYAHLILISNFYNLNTDYGLVSVISIQVFNAGNQPMLLLVYKPEFSF